MQHMEHIQKSREGQKKRITSGFFRECLFWIHAQSKQGNGRVIMFGKDGMGEKKEAKTAERKIVRH